MIFLKETISTGDNVLDGTPCSYDHPSNICVQGQCINVGCDRILNSPLEEDRCGICAGDGSKCSVQERTVKKRIGHNFTKLFVIPRGARNIEIENGKVGNISLILRERKSGADIFDSSTLKGHWTTISEGTKFQFQQLGKNLIITARGPLLAPIFVGMTSPNRMDGTSSFKFITENLEDTHVSRHRYSFVVIQIFMTMNQI